MILSDDMSKPSLTTTENWLLTPGAVLEPACGLNTNTLHFSGQSIYVGLFISFQTIGELFSYTYMEFDLYRQYVCVSICLCAGLCIYLRESSVCMCRFIVNQCLH